jgi:hypothetical protein
MSAHASYRCANCHWKGGGTAPERCPVCSTCQFEKYQPVYFGQLQFLVLTTACIMYMAITRMTGAVYDPFWMIIAGCREGAPSFCIIGVLVCGILIPGMFCWLMYRTVFSYAISAICLVLWILFCIGMRDLVFA